jgi:hypothetical protein
VFKDDETSVPLIVKALVAKLYPAVVSLKSVEGAKAARLVPPTVLVTPPTESV